ncbi:MAG: nuA3 HAT complex component nto1 [Cirrosporium novae-zelandiae]|nr:MAG: nuA3 HAT complex component nto1 [Cirrosporium novae-zelandiae]
MAPTPSSRRRPFNTRPRSTRRPRQKHSNDDSDDAEESPPRKLRYIPGGPGGGGRYIDQDGKETPAHGGAGKGTPTFMRTRLSQENTTNIIRQTSPRPRRERVQARPRYSSAAAAAAAVVQGDGYKPREERSWEEFHHDLDIDAKLPLFSAAEVDGLVPTANSVILNGSSLGLNGNSIGNNGLTNGIPATPPVKRRPGRPPRRPDAMLQGIGTPDTPKVVPLPGPNPREKLTLPKPLFRRIDPFVTYETHGAAQQNYVDRTMANVGYQESDMFGRSPRKMIRAAEGAVEEDLDLGPSLIIDGDVNAALGSNGVGRVEYDMDEQDEKWLEAYNALRREEQVEAIKPAIFEITMTKIEKEWHALEKRIPKPSPKPPQTHRPRSSSAAAVNGEPHPQGEEQDSKCAICDDGDCENTNAIVFCDGCDLAVHQECYGVPFIPEGQWLCRKCQLLGRGIPTCIFCPNTDGAFKQTSTSRWAHLLCAIWIPEVSLGNTTFMEPVLEVEKVPRQRWKLNCYICHQKMGACIQCSNKNCFVAFHVTCARRAQLFLKMKSGQGSAANLEPNLLKAYCDKHSPHEWQKEHNTEEATLDAIEYYHRHMHDRVWADSQPSALTTIPTHEVIGEDSQSTTGRVNPTVGGRRKRNEQKTVWKLPSGAPVVPQVLFNSVESSLQRFTVRKRKDYAADACKYWTLKREARRGAALLKRLQLQMETFTSMEMTRRDFASMGAVGASRLQRRIDFAELLLQDLGRLRSICHLIKQREQEKLQDTYLLRDIVDTVYFPITPLLRPIMDNLQRLDSKNLFREGFDEIRAKVESRHYVSTGEFAMDLRGVFSSAISLDIPSEDNAVQLQINGDLIAKDLTLEQKERRRLAKRLIKIAQPALKDAVRKEADLSQIPFEKELLQLDLLVETSLSRRGSLAADASIETSSDGHSLGDAQAKDIIGALLLQEEEPEKKTKHEDKPETDEIMNLDPAILTDPIDTTDPTLAVSYATVQESVIMGGPMPIHNSVQVRQHFLAQANGQVETAAETSTTNGNWLTTKSNQPALEGGSAPTPAISYDSDEHLPLYHGGITWYMEPFDPDGTTIHDERWTGREVLSRMSEELSEMDDEALERLADDELVTGEGGTVSGTSGKPSTNGKKRAKRRRRW